MDDIRETLASIARDGARPHQLRFARERLEKLRTHIVAENERATEYYGKVFATLGDWTADIDYAIAQIKSAEGMV